MRAAGDAAASPLMARRRLLLLLVVVATAVDGRPTGVDEPRQRSARSAGKCGPKTESPLLEQRTLCPFTKHKAKVFVGLSDREVERAVLDPECADGDRSCGFGSKGECVAVNARVTSGDMHETVPLAFVCAYRLEAAKAHKEPALT